MFKVLVFVAATALATSAQPDPQVVAGSDGSMLLKALGKTVNVADVVEKPQLAEVCFAPRKPRANPAQILRMLLPPAEQIGQRCSVGGVVGGTGVAAGRDRAHRAWVRQDDLMRTPFWVLPSKDSCQSE